MAPSLQNIIAQKLNIPPGALEIHPIGGGSINQTFRLTTLGQNLFCKINSVSRFPQLFQKEAKALRFLALQNNLKTPQVLHYIETDAYQVLIMEWIDSGPTTERFWKAFGCQLAALHSITNNNFGWEEDNYMGSVVQHNKWTADWPSFFSSQRLLPLAKQCLRQKLLATTHITALEKVCDKLGNIFNPADRPALLHGDLWSGNFMCSSKEEPVLIDPAIYFGHPSVDLAMTTLFGGSDKAFYEAYQYHSPFPSNYQEQWSVCNLYPLLIHLLLFDSSYRPQIEQIVRKFI